MSIQYPLLLLAILLLALIGFAILANIWSKRMLQRLDIWLDFARSVGGTLQAIEVDQYAMAITCPTPHGNISFTANVEQRGRYRPVVATEVSIAYAGPYEYTHFHQQTECMHGNSPQDYYVGLPIDSPIRPNAIITNVLRPCVTGTLRVSARDHCIVYRANGLVNDPTQLKALYDMMLTLLKTTKITAYLNGLI